VAVKKVLPPGGVRVYHAAGVARNLEYGCVEVCRQKYSDGPEYETHLAAILAAIDASDETSR